MPRRSRDQGAPDGAVDRPAGPVNPPYPTELPAGMLEQPQRLMGPLHEAIAGLERQFWDRYGNGTVPTWSWWNAADTRLTPPWPAPASPRRSHPAPPTPPAGRRPRRIDGISAHPPTSPGPWPADRPVPPEPPPP